MTAKEFLDVIKSAGDYNHDMTTLIEEYGRMVADEAMATTGKYIGYGSSGGLSSAVAEAITDLPDFTHINIVKGLTMSGGDWYECVVTKSTR